MNYAQLVQDVIDGNEDPIKAYTVLKEHADFISNCLNEIKPDLQHALDKIDEKKFSMYGYSFEKRAGGAIYDYSPIKEWADKKAELTALELQYKSAYQNSLKGLGALRGDEVLELPAVKFRSDSLIMKKNEG